VQFKYPKRAVCVWINLPGVKFLVDMNLVLHFQTSSSTRQLVVEAASPSSHSCETWKHVWSGEHFCPS